MYDVIIIGGGTSGCACAWNCGRLGLKTLLIEKNSYLGGTMTGALVVPVMKSGENQINTDFYDELVKIMAKSGNQVTFEGNSGWFNPIALKDTLINMLIENNVEILLNTEFNKIKFKNEHVLSLQKKRKKILSECIGKIPTDNIFSNLNINSKMLSEYIEAKYFVDSTGDLNFCEKISCNFLENKMEYPPMSLRFIMSGIDLKEFANQLLEIDNDRSVSPVEIIGTETHLSTAYTWDEGKKWALAPLFDDAVSKNILKDTDRNYFQVFTIAGMPSSLAFNCPRIIENLNPLDNSDIMKAKKVGKTVVKRLEKFCKIYFSGFENAYVSHIADMVGVRASRRIVGKYVYTIDDLRSGKHFDNPAVISNYPVDVHTKEKNTSILEFNGEYQLPVESLMSADYDNLYVAGRGLSADEQAQGALRVQSSCFSMGEAVAKDIYCKITSNVV